MSSEFRVTKKALSRVRDMLRESDAPPGTLVRLQCDDAEGIRLQADTPSAGDEVFTIDDEDVLVLSASLRRRLAGRRLTVSEDTGQTSVCIR